MSLQAGYAQVNITPPIGIWMTGFAARARPADGVHDTLYAKALVVQSGDTQVALVALDLLQLDPAIVRSVREMVEDWTDIPPSHLLLNATHTHSGPAAYQFNAMGPMDESYCKHLGRQIATAVKLADDDLRPAGIRYGTSQARIGVNRRQRAADGSVRLGKSPDRPYDPTVHAMCVEWEDGRSVVLFSHAAHPVILGGHNLHFSADYCGVACRVIEDAPEQTSAMFLQGCCGNINADLGDGSFAHVESVGQSLGAAALEAVKSASPIEVDSVGAIDEVVQLPLQAPPSLEDADRQVEELEGKLGKIDVSEDPDGVSTRVARGMLDWAIRVRARAAHGNRGRHQPMAVQAVRIGDIAFCGLEAETFIEIGREIAARSPFDATMCLGTTNGCIGYLPTAESYPEGGYEVTEAIKYYGTLMWRPESAEVVTACAVRLLDQLMEAAQGSYTGASGPAPTD